MRRDPILTNSFFALGCNAQHIPPIANTSKNSTLAQACLNGCFACGEPRVKINKHGLDHSENLCGACERPIFPKDGEALHTFQDERVTRPKGLSEQVAREFNDDIS